ncbi:MAG: TetR/AcrR family transcriptional regulator [Bacteroidota bacterium]
MPRSKNFDRQEVLQKAVELFWQKGFHATSMQDLVDHLEINRGSMYNTFGGKEQLFQEALALYKKQTGQDSKDILSSGDGSERAFLTRFFDQEIKGILEDKSDRGCFFVNTTTELSNQSASIHGLMYDNMNEAIAFFAKVIQRGQAKGEISCRATPEVLARHLFTFQNGLKVVSKLEKDPSKLREIVQMQLDLLLGSEEEKSQRE